MKTLLDREKQGREVPELLDRPDLTREEEVFMDAYEKLSTERTFGFVAGPIPHSAVRRFALEEGLSPWELWEIVKELDALWRSKTTPKSGDRDGRLQDQNLRGSVRRGRRKSDSDEGG